jgi:hypothetical protein
MIFNSKSWDYLFWQLSLGREDWLILVDGKKKENRMDVCNNFKRMEMSKDNVESLKFAKKFINSFKFSKKDMPCS